MALCQIFFGRCHTIRQYLALNGEVLLSSQNFDSGPPRGVRSDSLEKIDLFKNTTLMWLCSLFHDCRERYRICSVAFNVTGGCFNLKLYSRKRSWPILRTTWHLTRGTQENSRSGELSKGPRSITATRSFWVTSS
jgi:hypothetical protein